MKRFSLYQWNYGRYEQHVWRELHPGPSLHRECDPSGQQGPPTQGLLWGHGGNQQLSEMQAPDMCAGRRYSRKYWDDLQVYSHSWWRNSGGGFISDSRILFFFFLVPFGIIRVPFVKITEPHLINIHVYEFS